MRCGTCGCSDDDPCYDESYEITCSWSAAGLCSFCAMAGQPGAPSSDRMPSSQYPNLERAGFTF